MKKWGTGTMAWTSRKNRKRNRRRLAQEQAEGGGERQAPKSSGGIGGPLCLDGTRADLRFLAHAIKAGWLISHALRPRLLRLAKQALDPAHARLALAAAWVIVRAEERNLESLRRILEGRQ